MKKRLTSAYRHLRKEWSKRAQANQAPDWNMLLDSEQIRESVLKASERMNSETSIFTSRQQIRNWAFKTLIPDRQGLILEFGVHNGASISEISKHAGRKVYGFDAFEGLRDPWSKPDRTVGAMDLGGEIPDHLRSMENVDIPVGWVEETLPSFLGKHRDSISLVHLDLDVYPPTKFVLELVKPILQPGAHLIFDDMFGFIGWRNHSFRALFEVFSKEEVVAVGLSPDVAVFRYCPKGQFSSGFRSETAVYYS